MSLHTALGSSGAWVTLGDKICGYIVAIRRDIPWAYMIAIEPTLKDIGRIFRTNDVRLPKIAEAESLSTSFVPMEMSAGPGVSLLEMAPDRDRVSEFDGDLRKSRKAQALMELPSDSRPGVCELESGPANSGTTLVQRQDTGLDEKSSMLGDAPQTSRAQPSLPQHESRYDNFNNDSRMIGPEPLSSRYIPIPGTERDPNEKISASHRSQDYLPYRIWHTLELLILHGEYRRRKERRRLCGIRLPLILIFSSYTFDHDFNQLPNARRWFRGTCRVSVHCMFLSVDILFNILYLVICFPLICWVAYRYLG